MINNLFQKGNIVTNGVIHVLVISDIKKFSEVFEGIVIYGKDELYPHHDVGYISKTWVCDLFKPSKLKISINDSELRRKSLLLVSEKLNNIDTHLMHVSVLDALDRIDISNTDKTTILKALQFETSKMNLLVMDAKDWIDTIIHDIDEHTNK